MNTHYEYGCEDEEPGGAAWGERIALIPERRNDGPAPPPPAAPPPPPTVLEPLPLHYCAGRFCPGLSWPASASRHPYTCVVPDLPGVRLQPRARRMPPRWRTRRMFNRPQGLTSPLAIRRWGVNNLSVIVQLTKWRKALGCNYRAGV